MFKHVSFESPQKNCTDFKYKFSKTNYCTTIFLNVCRGVYEQVVSSVLHDAAGEPTEWERNCSQPASYLHSTNAQRGRSSTHCSHDG